MQKESLIRKLYDATNDGLDIILSYYPQAVGCVENKAKFKIRAEERTPSASCISYNDKEFGNVWKVTDFGNEGHPINPIEIAMQEESLEFREALHRLCDRYGVTEFPISELNKAKVEYREATDDETEGKFDYELNEKLSEFELSVLGPMVNQKVCDKYKFYSVKEYRKTKNRKTTIVKATETYPIFIWIEAGFKKIFQPLNHQKSLRFWYDGDKPKDFIGGLKELQAAYSDYIKKLEREIQEESSDGEKKPRKLPAAIFCSGERDALNVAGMGYFPLWLNSETARVSKYQMNEILKMVEKVYNIPDIDETGLKKGKEFAMEHIDVFTIELPDWLCHYRDNRGNHRKDLRDFLDIKPYRKDFEDLVNTALACKFWEPVMFRGKKRMEINSKKLIRFLSCNDFRKIMDKETKEAIYCRINGYKVERIKTKEEINDFVYSYLEKHYIDIEVQNLFINSKRTQSLLNYITKTDADFNAYTMESQKLFFKNTIIDVSKSSIEDIKHKKMTVKVWDNEIINHDFKRIEPSFKWKYNEKKEEYTIDILQIKSHYFRTLINASRIFWREELEYRIQSEEENKKYASDYKFALNGSRLTDKEQEEQMQHLVNKMYVIGYLMHGYKSKSKAMAVWAMENKVPNEDDSHGGTGKSFMIDFIKELYNYTDINGRDKDLNKNRFKLSRVDKHTKIIHIDETTKYFNINPFFAYITGSMETEQKNQGSKEIKYKESPKLVISSNHPPPQDDPSTMRRLLFCIFSDYYHQKTDKNDYLETRKIKNDFGYDLHDAVYKEDNWNEDFNFCVDCLQFYLDTLETNTIVQPPIQKVQRRINEAKIDRGFKEWANEYFTKDSGNLDRNIPKFEMMIDYDPDIVKTVKKNGIEINKIDRSAAIKFKYMLELWVKTNPKIECMNPPEYCSTSDTKRILHRDENTGISTEYIHIRSKTTDD